MIMNEVLVSISCLTYNHAPYIRQSFEGMLMQKTDFAFEILVHDDASTDGTTDIIREYEQKYPDIIKPIYEIENQWSKGRKGSGFFNFPRAKGKYIAMCEGDDYWTDVNKLQRQVDFLETHDEYVAVGENGLIFNVLENKNYPFSKSKERDLTASDFIKRRRIPTASVVFCTSAITKFDYGIDTYIFCYLSTQGKFRYLTNMSSVYRAGQQGITRNSAIFNEKQLLENNDRLRKLCVPDYVSIHVLQTARAFILLSYFIREIKNKHKKIALNHLSSALCCGFLPFLNATWRYLKDSFLYRFLKIFGVNYIVIR